LSIDGGASFEIVPETLLEDVFDVLELGSLEELFYLTRATERNLRGLFLRLAFFGLSGLNVFFSMSFILRASGLTSLVLMSPFLDWTAWVVSGNAFGWTCLARSDVGFMLHLGVATLAGSVLQVLPTVVPGHWSLLVAGQVGAVLMPCAVVTSTSLCIRKSRKVFSISPAGAARLFLTFFSAMVVPLQVWWIVGASRLSIVPRTYPQVDVYATFERLWQMLLPVTTVLFILLTTKWLWSPLAAKIASVSKRPKNSYKDNTLQAEGENYLRSGWRLLAVASLPLAIMVSGYRWFHGYPLGDDAKYYSLILRQMDATGIYAAFSTERPFLFLGLYAIEKALGLEASLLLRLVPLALSIILVAAVYYFTRFITGSEKVAALAATFAASSPHVTVGTEYFIVANWLGISLMMLFLCTVLKSVETRSISWVLLTIALSILTLAVHYFTWLFMIFVVLAYLLLGLMEDRPRFRRNIGFPILLISGCMVPIVPALLVAYLVGGGLLASLQLAKHMIGLFLAQATPINFVSFLMNYERVQSYFGREHYAIPLLFLLALIGSIELRGLKSDRGRLVRSWTLASCIGLIMVYYNEWWRFLYMIPFEILGAFGLAALLRQLRLDEQSTIPTTNRNDLLMMGFQLALFLAVGMVLAFSSMPSYILLICPVLIAFVKLYSPFEGDGATVFVVVTFLALEQVARALCVLA